MIVLAIVGLAVNMAVQITARRRDAASLRVVGLPLGYADDDQTPRVLPSLDLPELAGLLAVACAVLLCVG